MQKAKGGRSSSGLADDRLNGEPHLIDRKEKRLSPMAYELNHSQKLPRNHKTLALINTYQTSSSSEIYPFTFSYM
jgi:hypothetical protein